jgi:hypothetical protein
MRFSLRLTLPGGIEAEPRRAVKHFGRARRIRAGTPCVVAAARACDPLGHGSNLQRGTPMYARVTNFKVEPSRLPELSIKIKEMGPRAKALPGMVTAYAAWRADGQGVVVAVYKSKQDADSAVARIQALWGDLAGLLSGAPKTDAYETAEHLTA